MKYEASRLQQSVHHPNACTLFQAISEFGTASIHPLIPGLGQGSIIQNRRNTRQLHLDTNFEQIVQALV